MTDGTAWVYFVKCIVQSYLDTLLREGKRGRIKVIRSIRRRAYTSFCI